jgi:hypothetical protein
MFAISRTRWQTRPLSRRAKRRSSAAPGSLRKKYAGIVHPPNMVCLSINSTTSGDHRKPVLFEHNEDTGLETDWRLDRNTRLGKSSNILSVKVRTRSERIADFILHGS